MFHLTPQEKSFVWCFCVIVIAGSIANATLKEGPRLLNRPPVTRPKPVFVFVNLNQASLDDLVKIPGIGPKSAQLIIQKRQREGGFKSLQELRQIKGITQKRYERLIAHFTI